MVNTYSRRFIFADFGVCQDERDRHHRQWRMAERIYYSTFFTGACIGKAIALLISALHPALKMIAVMAALNAAVTRTPISTTLLLTKLSGVSPLTPILFASLVGFFLSPKLPFIKSQMKSQAD